MNYFDPARPKIGDRPALLGVPCVIPGIYFTPTVEGDFLAEVFTMIAPNVARWLSCRVAYPDMMMDNLKEDPEKLLTEFFGWSYNQQPIRKSRVALSLNDLGNLE